MVNELQYQFELQPTLIDDVVELRPLGANDFERVFSIASDPMIWEQHPVRERYKREVFQLFFDGAVKSKGAFLIFDKPENDLIGCTRYYDLNLKNSSVAIGYTFLIRRRWGTNHNRAAKKLLLDHAFRFVNSVLFHIGAENIRSQKAVLKLGAKKINEVYFDHNGVRLLHFEYEITRQDWIAGPR